MREIDRIDAYIARIEEIWKSNPDLRFTQLILNCFNDSDYYLEDRESLQKIIDFYKGGLNA